MKPAVTTGTGSHKSALDGLRALAIFSVMCAHAGVPGSWSGWIGVDLFFVLSGFLITTLLAMERAATDSFAWGLFMLRRALRLMPAYFLYAALLTLLMWAWPGSERGETGGWNAGDLTTAIWTYTINFAPKGGIWNGQVLTLHLWSLAVEQQYYLVWPLVLLALGSRQAAVRRVAIALAVLATAAFLLTPEGLQKTAMLYTRGFSLLVASAVALWVFHRPGLVAHATFNRVVDGVGALLLVALAVAAYAPGWSEGAVREVFLPPLVLVFAVWIARLWYGQSSSWPRRLLQRPELVYVGKISYGIYLYHEAVRVAVWYLLKPAMSNWPPAAGFVARLLLYFVVSGVLAALSYHFFETRFLRFAGRLRPPRAANEPPQAA